jgi:hypothetical protein
MKLYESVSRAFNKFTTLFKKNEDPREAKYWKAFVKFHDIVKTRNIFYISSKLQCIMY